VDPYSILGITPGSGERELTAAYREQAKRWHPDRGGGEDAVRRMAEINAAYDLLRAGAVHAGTPPPPVRSRGHGLSAAMRRALGPELLETLAADEQVRLVTPTSTWASPRAVLAMTERRLLWLLDDAPVARVRTLPFRDITAVSVRVHRPRRRAATLSLRTTSGRRHAFAELRPQTAATIARQLSAAAV
jgi:hypothetical protein